MTCPSLSTGGDFLSTLLQHIDCQGRTVGLVGYQALSDTASPLSLALTALLTIFIALFGLRLVLGETPSLRDGVLSILKIGVVLLLATSWPAYRTLVYDVITDGPGQLSAAIGGPAGLPGATGDLVSRLQVADDALVRLITLGSGRNDLVSKPAASPNGAVDPERVPIADDLAFGAARILFLSSIVAAFAVARLGAGVLLALAPLLAGLLLFDIGRGLLVGWARGLVFTLLASLAVTILLGVELALLEPWLTHALQLRQSRIITSEAPVELLVLTLAFALALLGVIAVILRLAFMPNLTVRWFSATGSDAPALQPTPRRPEGTLLPDNRTGRAIAVASAVAALHRRETARATLAPSRGMLTAFQGSVGTTSTSSPAITASIAQGPRRKQSRKSIAAKLRDRKS